MIDIHTHLADKHSISPGFIEGISESIDMGENISQPNVKRILDLHLLDSNAAGLIGQMDLAGVETSILLIADYGVALGEAAKDIFKIHEHHTLVCKKSGNRLFYFAGIDPRRGVDVVTSLLQYAADDQYCKGIKLYPPCGFELDDEELDQVWQFASDRRLPVLTHTGPSLAKLRTEERYPWSVSKVLEKFPKVQLVLAHAPIWDLERTIQLLLEYPNNLFADISTYQNLSDKELEKMLLSVLELVSNQVLFGSDYPLYNMSGNLKSGIDRIKKYLNLEQEHLLFKSNAEQLLWGDLLVK